MKRGRGTVSAFFNKARRFAGSITLGQIGPRMNRAKRLNYCLGRKPDFIWSSKGFPAYEILYDAWTANNAANTWDMARFHMLYLNALKVLEDDLRGDIVELGVYKGNSAAVLAAFAREKGRRLYLFDTFSGFDRADLIGHDAHRETEFGDTSLEMVMKLVGTENVQYVKGLFPESCSQIALPEEIVLVHLDCDLYKPLKAGLELFYPRLVAGGLLIIHDYGSGGWPGATSAVDEFFRDRPEKPVVIPDKSGTAIIRKAFC